MVNSRSNRQSATLAWRLVRAFFDDSKIAALWFRTENPLLGGVKPADLVRIGRADKLLEFVENQLEQNTPARERGAECNSI